MVFIRCLSWLILAKIYLGQARKEWRSEEPKRKVSFEGATKNSSSNGDSTIVFTWGGTPQNSHTWSVTWYTSLNLLRMQTFCKHFNSKSLIGGPQLAGVSIRSKSHMDQRCENAYLHNFKTKMLDQHNCQKTSGFQPTDE